MSLTVNAIRFTQKGVCMYLTALPVGHIDLCSVDHWEPKRPGKWKGYQRGLVKDRVRDLACYLQRPDGILPVAGLLNVREKNQLRFRGKASSSVATVGKLTIEDYTNLWVVDMQHRLAGIKEAHRQKPLRDFLVPVLITEGLDQIAEAGQFYVINTRSRRMGVDLTRRLLIEHNQIKNLTDVKEWELRAVRIAIRLNKDINTQNPWYGRIREPEIERLDSHIATEKSFIPSLKWLLTAPDLQRKSVKRMSLFLARMWHGLQQNMPEAFDRPKAYLLQKTSGYMAFHRLAPLIYRATRAKGHTAKVFEKFFRVFSHGGKYDSTFWDRKNASGAKTFGTGQSAYARLAMALADELGLKK